MIAKTTLAAAVLAAGLSLHAPAASAQQFLVSGLNSFCIEAAGGATQGAAVVNNTCVGTSTTQHVRFSGRGELRIGQMCLDAAGGQGRPGDRVVMWPCSGAANQQWALDGGRLVGINGLCLDVANNNLFPRAGLVVWTCNGGANQRWSLGTLKPATTVGLNPQQADKAFQAKPQNAAPVIAAGGGNVIAAGGGNVIAAGGGN